MPTSLSDMIAVIEDLYDPAWAQSWDAVGLVCGDPDRPVRKVMLAVDPVAVVVEEALDWGADLLVTHHPLLLRPVNGVPATTPKGRLVHRMIAGGLALYTAHTNADVADPGVSDALARAVGLTGRLAPLVPDPGDQERRRGLGRVGDLPRPLRLADFAARVAEGLPATAAGIRVAGDRDRMIRTVAVCGGAGDSLLAAVQALGADAFLTADLRHHPASEFREQVTGPGETEVALLDAAHWATEWPWLADARRRLAGIEDAGIPEVEIPDVEIRVSAIVTDVWTGHYRPDRCADGAQQVRPAGARGHGQDTDFEGAL